MSMHILHILIWLMSYKCAFGWKIYGVFTQRFCFLVVIQEPSLFAVAKLLETGLVNMDRIEILWRPLTGHLLEVTSISSPTVQMKVETGWTLCGKKKKERKWRPGRKIAALKRTMHHWFRSLIYQTKVLTMFSNSTSVMLTAVPYNHSLVWICLHKLMLTAMRHM